MTGRKESSGSDSFVQPEFVQLSQETAVSVLMRSTDSKQLFSRLAD